MQQRDTQWGLPLILIAATFLSTFYVGAGMVLGHSPASFQELGAGWVFSVPLMGILLAHEFGHFFAGRYHRVDVSPPYFIPVPFFLLGTMGAVIQIRERIRSRNALLDIGAAGPLAGMAVAVPVMIYGMVTSPIGPLPDATYMLEGRSLLYLALLGGLKGPIPEGYDIMLTPTPLKERCSQEKWKSSSVSRSTSATRSAWSSPQCSIRTANSSPPSRAMVSRCRTFCWSRAEICRRSSSPAA